MEQPTIVLVALGFCCTGSFADSSSAKDVLFCVLLDWVERPGISEDILPPFIRLKGISEGTFIHWKVTLERSLSIRTHFLPFLFNPQRRYKRSPDGCLLYHKDAV